MKFSYLPIDHVFEFDEKSVLSLVIEEPNMFLSLSQDIFDQTQGLAGKSVLSEDNKTMDFSKNADIITSFFPFELNRKSLLTKILSELEKTSQNEVHYLETMELMAKIEKYLDDLTVDFPCDLEYNKLTISSVLKSVGIEVHDDSVSLAEKLLNYMELVREFDREKVFFTVNFRSFVDEKTAGQFIQTAVSHKYRVLMLESHSYPILQNEIRYTVDSDLCEF